MNHYATEGGSELATGDIGFGNIGGCFPQPRMTAMKPPFLFDFPPDWQLKILMRCCRLYGIMFTGFLGVSMTT